MKEVDPAATKRAEAFRLWTKAPMPMLTLFKTLNVSPLLKACRRGYKFNMLLCWCIGKAASLTEEFYLLPAGEKLLQYDRLAVSIVVPLSSGGIGTCDVPFSDDLAQFAHDYGGLTAKVSETGQAHDLSGEYMVIGTSALVRHEIDGAVNIYAGIYNNPFLIWGRYRRRFSGARLPLSFQFHHAQMDGEEAAAFLDLLQKTIDRLKRRN